MLLDAGARVETSNDTAARYVGRLLQVIECAIEPAKQPEMAQVDLDKLKQPLAGINVGLDSFTEALIDQESQVVHMDWKPVAGGNEKLVGILERMKAK